MYSICVKGTIKCLLTITENKLVVSYNIQNRSNVIFPTKAIAIAIDLQKANATLDYALELLEQKVGKLIELYIQFPKTGPIYKVDVVESKLF